MPDLNTCCLLRELCQELNGLIQEQSQAIQQRNFEKLTDAGKEIARVQETIETTHLSVRNDDVKMEEFRECFEDIKNMLQKALQDNEANIHTIQGFMSQLQTEMKNINQTQKYLIKTGNRQSRIIDKNV